MYSQGSWVSSGNNLSHFGYSQKNLWRAVSISQIRGVWGRNSILCLSQGRKRMENRGNSAPGQLLIPEQQQQQVRIPWNGNPMEWESPVARGHGTCCPPCPGQNSKGSGKKPGRAPELWPSRARAAAGGYSMESFPVFHREWDALELLWGWIMESLEFQLECN